MNASDQSTGTERQTAASAPQDPRPPLRRRSDDRIVAGVASGLAAYLDVDPALVRIGFVVLLFASGIGLPLYVAAWLLIPEADPSETAPHQLVRSKGPSFWIGIGILVIVALAVADTLPFGGGDWWPLVLIAAGVALWRAGQDDGERRVSAARTPAGTGTTGPDAGHPPNSPARAGAADTQEIAMSHPTATAPSPAAPPRTPVDFTPPPVPQRSSAVLAWVTVALALIAAGVTVLLDGAGVVDAHLGHVLASSLVVVGLGLVVGAWFGRARGLLFPGLVLTPLVIAASLFHAADVPVDAGFGDRVHTIASATDVEADGYRLAAGQMTFRLDELRAGSDPVELRAEVGAGQIDVRVPSDAEVRVSAEAGVGELVLFDRTVDGVGLDEELVREGGAGAPVIVLDLRAGAGQIVVRSGAASLETVPDQEFTR